MFACFSCRITIISKQFSVALIVISPVRGGGKISSLLPRVRAYSQDAPLQNAIGLILSDFPGAKSLLFDKLLLCNRKTKHIKKSRNRILFVGKNMHGAYQGKKKGVKILSTIWGCGTELTEEHRPVYYRLTIVRSSTDVLWEMLAICKFS